MRVEQIMSRAVETCSPEDTLDRAVQLMWDHDCGAVPVVEDGRPVAMITDRDACMAAYLKGARLSDLTVRSAMSNELIACRAEDTVRYAEKLMREKKIRRIAVVSDSGELVGIISLADLAREAARERGRPIEEVRQNEVAGTLASICTPRQTGTLVTKPIPISKLPRTG